MIKLLSHWCTNMWMGPVIRELWYTLGRMLGEHKLHGWTVGTIANISCWGGWEGTMHVLGKQLPHSGVERVERVGVGGTVLIKSSFLINIIVCIDAEDTVWWENNVQISKGELLYGPTKKNSLDAKIIFNVGRQTYTNETEGPRKC